MKFLSVRKKALILQKFLTTSHKTIMKKILLPLIALTAILVMNSCQTSKQVPYMQNIDTISLAQSRMLFDAKIMPKDQLRITVHCSDPAAAAPFNLTISRTVGADGGLTSGSGSLQTYLVENDGTINFPVLGRIHVEGLTKGECERMIEQKIAPYLAKTEKPVVKVMLASYRVTLMGDVNAPKVVTVGTEKMSILEALASAGDLTIYGQRQNVLLIREDKNGEKHAHRLDLTDANFINSPYYYLQQNDVIYVQPNATKAKNSALGQSTSIWFSFISISTSVASLLVNILRD